jgi:hypothetical protein
MGRPPRRPDQEARIRRRLTILIALFAVAACAAVPALAAGGRVNVPKKLGTLVDKVESRSGLPVLLPSYMRVDVAPSRIHGTASSTKRSYDLELGVGRGCHGATACFVAAFFGRRGAQPALRRKVKLAHGIIGRFKPITCGASCSPSEIQWVEDGVLYDIQYKGVGQSGEKATMIGLANSAIRHGKR